MGYDDIGYNSYDIPLASPYMTSLAESGIVLSHYYSVYDCTPSRACLLTGKYAIRLGLQHDCMSVESPFGLPLTEKLLPYYLSSSRHKYVTHIIGKVSRRI